MKRDVGLRPQTSFAEQTTFKGSSRQSNDAYMSSEYSGNGAHLVPFRRGLGFRGLFVKDSLYVPRFLEE